MKDLTNNKIDNDLQSIPNQEQSSNLLKKIMECDKEDDMPVINRDQFRALTYHYGFSMNTIDQPKGKLIVTVKDCKVMIQE